MTDTAASPLRRDPTEFLARHREALDIAIDYADQVCRSSGVPARFRGKTTDSAVAILYGADLGLSPLQSLQQIYNKYGQPAVYARTMQAILESHGYHFETVLDTDEAVTVRLTTPDGRSEENTWDWARAEQAGYTPRFDSELGDWARTENGEILGNEKYLTDPRAMYWAKAVSVLARHLAPHLLLGMPYSREDLESEPEPERKAAVTPAVVAAEPIVGREVGGLAIVQDWTPPPADVPDPEGTGPGDDTAVPDDPGTSDEGEKQDTAPPVQASTEPEPATPEQQERLSELLAEEGHRTVSRKRNFLSEHIGRGIKSVEDLTSTEAGLLILQLSGTPMGGEEGHPVSAGGAPR
jgi:hypothetical protein